MPTRDSHECKFINLPLISKSKSTAESHYMPMQDSHEHGSINLPLISEGKLTTENQCKPMAMQGSHECGSINLPLISEGESAAARRRWRKRFSCLPLQNPGAADLLKRKEVFD